MERFPRARKMKQKKVSRASALVLRQTLNGIPSAFDCLEACGEDDAVSFLRQRAADTLVCDMTGTENDKCLGRFLEDKRDWLRAITLHGEARSRCAGTKLERRCMDRLFRGLSCALHFLEAIELTGCAVGLEDATFATLGRGIATGALRFLSLRHVPLRDSGLDVLAPGLRDCRCVYISLRDCKLTDTSARALASIVRAHASRRDEATWAHTLRRAVVIQEEAQAAARTDGLAAFDIADNELGDETSVEFAAALDEWLVGIHLAGNSKLCAEALREAIVSRRCGLAAVRLEGTAASEECRRDIEHALSSPKDGIAGQHQQGALRIVQAWAEAPNYGLSMDTARRVWQCEPIPEPLSRLVVDHATRRGRLTCALDLEKALLKARVDCSLSRDRRQMVSAAHDALQATKVHASSRGAQLAKRRAELVAAVGCSEKIVDALVATGETIGAVAAGYGKGDKYSEPSEETCRACDALHRLMRLKRWRPTELFAAAAPQIDKKVLFEGVSAADLARWLAVESHNLLSAAAICEDRARHSGSSCKNIEPETLDFGGYVFAIAGSPALLDAAQLDDALHKVKRRGRQVAAEARGVLVMRRVCAAVHQAGEADARNWFRSLGSSVGLASLATHLAGALSASSEAHGVAAAARLFAFSREQNVDEVEGEELARAVDRAEQSDSVLAQVAHAYSALKLDKLRASNKWTMSEVARQAMSLNKHANGTMCAVTMVQLRAALADWGVASRDKTPDLSDHAMLARAANALGVADTGRRRLATRHKTEEHDDDSNEASEDGGRNEISLSEVLSFARRVATDDGKLVDIERLESAVRAYRRGAAGVAKLRQAAMNLNALRDELESRDLDLGSWLEAAADLEPPDDNKEIDAEDIKNGLLALLVGPDQSIAHAFTGLVEAAVDALELFSDDHHDRLVRRYAEANARAFAAASDDVSDRDLAEFLTAADLTHAELARRLDLLLARRKWRVPDLCLSLRKWDDDELPSPRALCRALLAWRIFQPRDQAERSDFQRIVGLSTSSAAAKKKGINKHPIIQAKRRAPAALTARRDPFKPPVYSKRRKALVATSTVASHAAKIPARKKKTRSRQPNDDEILVGTFPCFFVS